MQSFPLDKFLPAVLGIALPLSQDLFRLNPCNSPALFLLFVSTPIASVPQFLSSSYLSP
jgi:hypothetical protein